jgi:hypothetical protein
VTCHGMEGGAYGDVGTCHNATTPAHKGFYKVGVRVHAVGVSVGMSVGLG